MTQSEQSIKLLASMFTHFKVILDAYQNNIKIPAFKISEINSMMEESYIFLKKYIPSQSIDNFTQKDLEAFLQSMMIQLPDLMSLADQAEEVKIILMSDFKAALRWSRNYQLYQNVNLLRSSILNQKMNVSMQVEVKS